MNDSTTSPSPSDSPTTDSNGTNGTQPDATNDQESTLQSSPKASVVIPTFNEEGAIAKCLDRVCSQTEQDIEILVVDGGSTDSTRSIVVEWSQRDPRVRLVDNPRKLQSAALNVALPLIQSDIYVRIDSRAFIEPDYVERCIDLINTTGAEVVGGQMRAVPRPTAVAQGIATANGTWWAVGTAKYHHDGDPGPADHVWMGTFQKEAVEAVGGWAEDVGVNEDWELNYRIRLAGGTVWLDPTLVSGYEPRPTFKLLAKQYFRYGRSKSTVARKHPQSVLPRQMIPATLVPVLLMAILPTRLRKLARFSILGHAALVAGLGVTTLKTPIAARLSTVVAAWIMHWAWAIGWWYGIIRPFPRARHGLTA